MAETFPEDGLFNMPDFDLGNDVFADNPMDLEELINDVCVQEVVGTTSFPEHSSSETSNPPCISTWKSPLDDILNTDCKKSIKIIIN